jgi:hypothetical protein
MSLCQGRDLGVDEVRDKECFRLLYMMRCT